MRLFVPGRVCLFGEHSDWAGGYRDVNPRIEKGMALIAGTGQGIEARVERHPDSLVLTSSTGVGGPPAGPRMIPMDPRLLRREAESGGFWSYVAGVAYRVAERYPVRGLALANDRMDLPVRKGLSSSAAICVLTARAFNRLYELGLSVRDEMELAYEGEIATGSKCGRMDQGCAYGSRPILMTFDGDGLEVTGVAAGGELHLLLVDLQSRKDTRAILARLHSAFPVASGEIARGLHDLLGPINRDIVGRAVQAVEAGRASALGALMVEAQAEFDRLAVPACPEELTAPALHRVLHYEPLQPFIWGGKGVGSQGDGAAQFVARSEADREASIEVLARELSLPCLRLTITGDAATLLPK